MKYPLYSIVVPVFNGEDFLLELCQRIANVFKSIDGDFELFLVEDCGSDNSWEVMKRIRNSDNRVKIVRLTKNFGQHNALMCGFSLVSGDFIITMDVDLQNPPEEIPKLINTMLNSDYDIVYGLPTERKHSIVRNLGSCIYHFFISLIFKRMPRFRLSSFRIVRNEVIQHVLKIPTPNPSVGLLMLKITERIGSVETAHHFRKYGSTSYSKMKLIQHFLNGVLYNSTLPLKGIFYLGILTSSLSIMVGIYFLCLYLFGKIGVQGWISIGLLILFFSGILMLSVGIIGEYLLRIIQEVRKIPTYVIRDKEM